MIIQKVANFLPVVAATEGAIACWRSCECHSDGGSKWQHRPCGRWSLDQHMEHASDLQDKIDKFIWIHLWINLMFSDFWKTSMFSCYSRTCTNYRILECSDLYFFSLRHWSLFFFWDYVGIHVFNFESAKNLGDPNPEIWHERPKKRPQPPGIRIHCYSTVPTAAWRGLQRCFLTQPATICNAGREASFHQDLRAQMIKLSSQKWTTETQKTCPSSVNSPVVNSPVKSLMTPWESSVNSPVQLGPAWWPWVTWEQYQSHHHLHWWVGWNRFWPKVSRLALTITTTPSNWTCIQHQSIFHPLNIWPTAKKQNLSLFVRRGLNKNQRWWPSFPEETKSSFEGRAWDITKLNHSFEVQLCACNIEFVALGCHLFFVLDWLFWCILTCRYKGVFLWQRNLPTGDSKKHRWSWVGSLNHHWIIGKILRWIWNRLNAYFYMVWHHFEPFSKWLNNPSKTMCCCVWMRFRCHLFCSWPVLYVQFEIPYPDYVCLWRGKTLQHFWNWANVSRANIWKKRLAKF